MKTTLLTIIASTLLLISNSYAQNNDYGYVKIYMTSNPNISIYSEKIYKDIPSTYEEKNQDKLNSFTKTSCKTWSPTQVQVETTKYRQVPYTYTITENVFVPSSTQCRGNLDKFADFTNDCTIKAASYQQIEKDVTIAIDEEYKELSNVEMYYCSKRNSASSGCSSGMLGVISGCSSGSSSGTPKVRDERGGGGGGNGGVN